MKRESLVFFLGLMLVLLPFFGIPGMWKHIAYVVLGLLLVLVGYQLRRKAYLRSIEDDTGERKTDAYVEQVEVFAEPKKHRDMSVEEVGVSVPKTRAHKVRTKTTV